MGWDVMRRMHDDPIQGSVAPRGTLSTYAWTDVRTKGRTDAGASYNDGRYTERNTAKEHSAKSLQFKRRVGFGKECSE